MNYLMNVVCLLFFKRGRNKREGECDVYREFIVRLLFVWCGFIRRRENVVFIFYFKIDGLLFYFFVFEKSKFFLG